jgi:hypothetical protein
MFLQKYRTYYAATNFRVSPPLRALSTGSPRLGRVAKLGGRATEGQLLKRLICGCGCGCRSQITSTESSICSSSPRHAVVVRVNDSPHLTHAEHSNNSKDIYVVFYLHTSKLQSLDISLVFVKDIVNAPGLKQTSGMSTAEVEWMDQMKTRLCPTPGPHIQYVPMRLAKAHLP